MNFGGLGAGFGGMGRGAANASLSAVLDRITTGRVDFLGIGDSNQLQGGFGWDHGFQYALSQRFSMYATGIISINENDASGSGTGYTYAFNGASTLKGATSGAPAFADAYLNAGSGSIFPHKYGYGDDTLSIGQSSASGMVISASGKIPAEDALRVHYCYATFASGTGQFGVCIRKESSPFGKYATGSFVTAPLTDAIVRNHIDVSADASRAGFSLGAKWTNVGTEGIEGPFFGLWSRVERTAVTNGFSYHTLGYYGGKSLRDMAYNLQQMSDTTLDNFLQEAIYLQGSTHTVVIFVNSGANDRNETGTSVGPGAVADGDSSDAYVDNFVAIRQRIEARWLAIGEGLEDLFWIVFPTHRISDPDDAELVSYRSAMSSYLATMPRAYFVDFGALMTAAEATANSWYASAGADPVHLTQAGYEALGVRAIDRVASQIAVSYETESAAIFAAMLAAGAEPDATRKGHINTRILALKNAGLWSKKDCDYMLAAHARAAALINWKNPGTFNLTETDGGNLTFTTDRGFTGNGTSSYLKTGFNPATAGGVYGLNDAHIGVHSRTSAQGSTIEIGARVGVNNDQCSLLCRNTSDVANILLNQDSAALAPAVTDGSGWFLGARRASDDIEIYRNGSSLGSSSLLPSQTVPSLEFYICARNNNGTAGQFSARQLSHATIGAGLSDAQAAALYAIDLAYLQAVGAA